MRFVYCATIAMGFAAGSAPAFSQPADPAAANRDLIGSGPKVSIQSSANGTIDVGGAGAASPKLIGENLRGNLGASIQPVAPAAAQPQVTVPGFSFETPNFTPNLRGGTSTGQRPTPAELNVAEGLVLPRFRTAGSATGWRSDATGTPSENWRYRYFNGRWWYWKANSSWAYWDGSRWLDRAGR
jgi:hypothetical protein